MASGTLTTTIVEMTTHVTCLSVVTLRCQCVVDARDHIRPWIVYLRLQYRLTCEVHHVAIFHHHPAKCSLVALHPADR